MDGDAMPEVISATQLTQSLQSRILLAEATLTVSSRRVSERLLGQWDSASLWHCEVKLARDRTAYLRGPRKLRGPEILLGIVGDCPNDGAEACGRSNLRDYDRLGTTKLEKFDVETGLGIHINSLGWRQVLQTEMRSVASRVDSRGEGDDDDDVVVLLCGTSLSRDPQWG